MSPSFWSVARLAVVAGALILIVLVIGRGQRFDLDDLLPVAPPGPPLSDPWDRAMLAPPAPPLGASGGRTPATRRSPAPEPTDLRPAPGPAATRMTTAGLMAPPAGAARPTTTAPPGDRDRPTRTVLGWVRYVDGSAASGWRVQLRHLPSGRVEATTLTARNGRFVFEDLFEEPYRVEVVDQDGRVVASVDATAGSELERVTVWLPRPTLFSALTAAVVSGLTATAATLGVVGLVRTGRPASAER